MWIDVRKTTLSYIYTTFIYEYRLARPFIPEADDLCFPTSQISLKPTGPKLETQLPIREIDFLYPKREPLGSSGEFMTLVYVNHYPLCNYFSVEVFSQPPMEISVLAEYNMVPPLPCCWLITIASQILCLSLLLQYIPKRMRLF